MDSNWPDGWATATLKAAEIPVTDFALSVLKAWNASTPLLAYTNNPLGMPSIKGVRAQLLNTGYALFPQMSDFRTAFVAFLKTPPGQKVRHALAIDEKYPVAYRAIHALPWSANNTETDWPSAVLDLTSQSYRTKAASVAVPADRKTSGAPGAAIASTSIPITPGRNAAQAAATIQDAASFIRGSIGRIG